MPIVGLAAANRQALWDILLPLEHQAFLGIYLLLCLDKILCQTSSHLTAASAISIRIKGSMKITLTLEKPYSMQGRLLLYDLSWPIRQLSVAANHSSFTSHLTDANAISITSKGSVKIKVTVYTTRIFFCKSYILSNIFFNTLRTNAQFDNEISTVLKQIRVFL